MPTDGTATVGLLADPGVPRHVAAAVADGLASDLTANTRRQWYVDVREESLPITPDGDIPLTAEKRDVLYRGRWCRLVYLSDLTHYRDGTPVRYLLADDDSAIVVFIPAHGRLRKPARVRRLLGELIIPNPPHTASELPRAEVRGVPGRLRMLIGMVHSNRPVSLVRALRGSTAVGMASGAFGIFFGSVWAIADSLSVLRLASTSIAAIAVLCFWLIVRNGLWTRREHLAPLDNTSTVVTVCSAVALLHAILFAGLLLLSAVVVEPTYLADQLRHSVTVADYLHLAWFSASMGTIAGALGSNFDDENVVREGTYSRRWHQRRLLHDDYSG